jgi:hypothetical protein
VFKNITQLSTFLHFAADKNSSSLGENGGTCIAGKAPSNNLTMLVQKTLHMGQSLLECKSRLANIHSYRRQFVMVTRATVTSSKTVDFSFRGPLGFAGHTVLLGLESDSPDEVVFESIGGNLDLMGIVDFTEVRPNCTEITLAMHYQIKNKFFAWLDRRLRFMDAFINRELRSVRAHFEGIAAPYSEPATILPMLETVTA